MEAAAPNEKKEDMSKQIKRKELGNNSHISMKVMREASRIRSKYAVSPAGDTATERTGPFH